VPLGFRDVMPALTTGRIEWVYARRSTSWSSAEPALKYMNDFAFGPGRGPRAAEEGVRQVTPGDREVLLQTAQVSRDGSPAVRVATRPR